ncbi:hypothetical protein [Candidatus Phytoplasma oryzae]|nr:hypothetical protein PIE28_01950 [Candidatus Phytoplasma oryzae]
MSQKIMTKKKFANPVAILLWLLVISAIVVGIVIYKDEQKTPNKSAETKIEAPKNQTVHQALQDTIKKLTDLYSKNQFVQYLIHTKEEELKNATLQEDEKTLLQALLDLRKAQKALLDERTALNYYYYNLTEEIQELEGKIQKSTTVDEKYRLKEEPRQKRKRMLKN